MPRKRSSHLARYTARLEAQRRIAQFRAAMGGRRFQDGPVLDAILEDQHERRLCRLEEREDRYRREAMLAKGHPDVVEVECLEHPEWGVMTLRDAHAKHIRGMGVEHFHRHAREGWVVRGKRWVERGKPWRPGIRSDGRFGKHVVCVERPELVFANAMHATRWLGVSISAVRNSITSGQSAGGYHWRYVDTPDSSDRKYTSKGAPIKDRLTGKVYANMAQLVTDLLHEDPEMAELAKWKPADVRRRRLEINHNVLWSVRTRRGEETWNIRRWFYVAEEHDREASWVRSCHKVGGARCRRFPELQEVA